MRLEDVNLVRPDYTERLKIRVKAGGGAGRIVI
jgi:hypothetical protein